MRIDVRIDKSGLEKAYKALQRIPGAFPQAVSSAMNRTLESMRTESARETAGRYFAKSGEVRKTLQLRTANAGNLYGAMISRGGRKSCKNTSSHRKIRRPETKRASKVR
ncbi:MAG: phage tail protein [Synergistaceae bacterium]|nr:phage tail protein [Synergistaceae bacterium]